MSEAMSSPAEARCANCGAALHGRFCAACGQPVKPLDPPARHFIGEFTQEFFDVDSRVLRSLRRLMFSPGFLTREHFEGRRAPWTSPLKLYLTASVAAFAILAFTGDDGGLKIALQQNKSATPIDSRVVGYDSAEALGAALAAARDTWIPRVMFLLVPFYGWLVSLVRRDAKRHYPAHLVFALHVLAAGFAMRALMTAMGALAPVAMPWFSLATPIYSVAYVFLAMRFVYGGSRLRAVRDVVLVAAVFSVALLGLAAVVVLTAVTGTRWLIIFGSRG